jgi:energy-converting hydrogenase Eha subunit B
LRHALADTHVVFSRLCHHLDMTKALKHRLAIGVAVTAVLSGGAIAAVSATGQGTAGKARSAHRTGAHRAARRIAGTGGVLVSAADYLGIAVSQLRSDLRSGKTLAQIADATPGRSEAGLIAALLAARKAKLAQADANLAQSVNAEVNRPLLGPGARHGRARGASAAALRYLGLTAATVRAKLRSGETLAQIAAATPGKSEAGLVEAIVVANGKRIAAAVSAGKLPKASESARVARLTKRVQAAVNRTHTAQTHPAKKTRAAKR